MHKLQTIHNLRNFIHHVRGVSTFPFVATSFIKQPNFLKNKNFNNLYRASFSSDSDSDSNNGNRFKQPIVNTLSSAIPNQYQKNSVFISKFFEIPNSEIFQFLDSLKLEYKTRSTGQIVLKYCPFCEKPHHNKPDNLWSLNLKPNAGAYKCFRCGHEGSWFDFKNILVGNGRVDLNIDSAMSYESQNKRKVVEKTNEPQLASDSWAYLRLKSLLQNEFPEINKYLTGNAPEERHLSLETLEKYKVGVGYETFLDENGEGVLLPCVYFPMFANRKDKNMIFPKNKSKEKPENVYLELENQNTNSTGISETQESNPENLSIQGKQSIDLNSNESSVIEINDSSNILVRTKIRAIFKKNKGHQRMEPSPGYWGLFGLNTVPARAKYVVITEGEYDAMAVYEATKMPAISLPNGANHLPLQVLPWLERFERIYLWMDADQAGQANAQNFAHKLGVSRVYLVNTKRYDSDGPKDANDALRKDPSSIERYIKEAKSMSRENITNFSEMKSLIYHRILKFDENTGIKSRYFKWYNSKFKGFRRGEMTILTGPTGSGKTSLLTQISLDFARQGVGTLWGSFEVKNEILLTNMLLQYSGVNLYKESRKFEYHAQNFEQIPLYFLKYFGSNEIEKILQTIDYAIYAYDIGHVIIDNLQFLLSGQGRGFERFDIQDDAISKLRDLATSKNVHVTLVIHPKKVDDNQDLTISSVFGSAKATQEADNIIILQNRPKYRVVDIKKNRFDGDLGKIPLGFDRDTKRFFELKEGEVMTLHRTPETIKEIIEQRKEKNQLEQLREEVHLMEITRTDENEEFLKKAEFSAQNLLERNGVENMQKNSTVKDLLDDKLNHTIIEEDLNKDTEELQEDLEILLSDQMDLRHNPELGLQNFDSSVENEILTNLVENYPEKTLNQVSHKQIKEENTENTQQREDKEKELNLHLSKENLEEKIKHETLEKQKFDDQQKPEKKNKKMFGLYGMMYEDQSKQLKQKDSFYTEEDRQAVRENMEFLENEKKNKFKEMKKNKQKSHADELFEAELLEANRKLNANKNKNK